MNLKELSKLTPDDIKNIDFSQLRENLSHRLDILINIVLIIATLIFSYNFIIKNKQKAKQHKVTITELNEKIKAVEELKDSQESLTKLFNDFPQSIESDKLINMISNFAVSHRVQILSFSPAESWTNDYYELTSINLKILSENYDDIINFINEIESTSYALRIAAWNSQLKDQSLRNQDDNADYSITANLEIGIVRILK